MDEAQQAPKWELVAEKLLNLAVLGVIAWSILCIDFTGHGRLLDKFTGRHLTSADSAALSAPSKAVLTKDSESDRFLITQPAAAPAAAPVAEAPRKAQPTAAELAAQVTVVAPKAAAAAPRRLTTSLAAIDDSSRQASQQTSASVGGGSGASPAGPSVAEPNPTPTYTTQAPEEGGKAVAARSMARAPARGEIMGKSAGPVYNLGSTK